MLKFEKHHSRHIFIENLLVSYTFLGFKETNQVSGVMRDNEQELNKKIIPLLNKCYEENQSRWIFWESLFSMIRKGYFKDLKTKWMEEADIKSKEEGWFRLRAKASAKTRKHEWIRNVLRTEGKSEQWVTAKVIRDEIIHSTEHTLCARQCPRGWKHRSQWNKGPVLMKVTF